MVKNDNVHQRKPFCGQASEAFLCLFKIGGVPLQIPTRKLCVLAYKEDRSDTGVFNKFICYYVFLIAVYC